MTKKETQSEIWVYERLRDISEEKLDTLNHQLRDLCEAEKLKLRHGDFGIEDSQNKSQFICFRTHNAMIKAPEFIAYHEKNAGKHWTKFMSESEYTDNLIVLGNIFDLSKEWGEPFEEYLKNNSAMGIQIIDDHIRLYACTGGKGCNKRDDSCYYQIESAERIWRKLGHAIVELKRRKENKCS